MKRIWDKSDLERLYIIEGKTLREIAQVYEVSHEAIRLQLDKHNITLRNKGRRDGKEYNYTPNKWKSLEDFLSYRVSCGKDIRVGEIPKHIRPCGLFCTDCHKRSNKLHFHHIQYPAQSMNDFIVLCASCHKCRHKGMTWARQLDLYRDRNNGMTYKQLATKYNISLTHAYLIVRKLKNGYPSTRKPMASHFCQV